MTLENNKNNVVCVPKSFKLAFKNETPNNILEINQEILESVEKYAIKAVIAYTKAGRAVTFEELASNGLNENLPEDGSEVVKVLTFDLVDEQLFVLETMSATPLSRLKLTIVYRRKTEEEKANSEADVELDPKLIQVDDYTANVFVKLVEPVEEKV